MRTKYPKKIILSSVLDKLQPGDVIAYSGNSKVSNLIKLFTRSSVSHIGVMVDNNNIIESIGQGVVFSLPYLLENYQGSVWWLPLALKARKRLDSKKLKNAAFQQIGKEYDAVQAVKSVLDKGVFGSEKYDNEEDFGEFFCSELVAALLEKAEVLPKINASEVTPIDLCRMRIYANEYFQIAGKDRRAIRGFNTVDPLKLFGR